jgi:hypothetical protein
MGSYFQNIYFEKSHNRFETAYPPVYPGMDAPQDWPPPPTDLPPNSIKSVGNQPSVGDLLAASKDLNRMVSHDKNKPDFQILELTELEFKRKYAAETVHLGKEFDFDKNKMANFVKSVYAFEGGGWGTYDTLSGMPQQITDDSENDARLKFHPSSEAIGYNQIMIQETVADVIQHGGAISARLNELALQEPDRANVLHSKAQLIEGLHDILAHKSTPSNVPPNRAAAYYTSENRIEQAAEALNLDGDIGPVIQSQELYYLLKFAKDNKFDDYLTAKTNVEIKHADEFDQLSLDKKLAGVSELIGLIKPSAMTAAKPETIDAFNSTVESLRLKFIALGLPPTFGETGSNQALERDHLSESEFRLMNTQILGMRRYGGENGPLSVEARALLDKVTFDYFGGYSVDRLQAPAIELGNLIGVGTAENMLRPEHSDLPTANFFTLNGYESNPVVSRRSTNELLWQIYAIMYGTSSTSAMPGIKQFDDVFDKLQEPTQAAPGKTLS